LRPKSRFTGLRKLEIFLEDLCLGSIQLMQLKVILTKGRKTTDVGFSGTRAALSGGLRANQIFQALQPFHLKVALRNWADQPFHLNQGHRAPPALPSGASR
jgi:hypothetical protein